MKAFELIALLQGLSPNAEIRVGDQVESGPYLHTSVVAVFKGHDGDVIICGGDDEQWTDETAKPGKGDEDLSPLWAVPVPVEDDNLPIG